VERGRGMGSGATLPEKEKPRTGPVGAIGVIRLFDASPPDTKKPAHGEVRGLWPIRRCRSARPV